MIRYALFVCLLIACDEHGKGGGFPDGGGGGSGGRTCGGFPGTQCSASEFCDFGRDSCGAADELGTCRPRPNGCDDVFAPVCGCDGSVHSNACDANAAGFDVNASGGCPVP